MAIHTKKDRNNVIWNTNSPDISIANGAKKLSLRFAINLAAGTEQSMSVWVDVGV